MQPNRSLVLACCATLLAACAGGGSSGPDASFTMYGSAHATAVSAGARLVGAYVGGSPTALKQVFYALWVSESADCSNPILVQDHGEAGKEVDYYADPVLFAASPPDGTYRCLVVRIGDTMRFTPDAAAESSFPGVCVAGDEYTFDVFRDGTWAVLDGPAIDGEGTHTAPVPQQVDLFFSTDEAAVETGTVQARPDQVILLSDPLVVPGQTTFFMDMTNKVQASSDGGVSDPTVCWLDSPEAGFR